MKTFIDLIGSSDYVWLPPVLFTFIVVIAGLIGAWNGWKTATYFFGWNLVTLIVAIFTVDPIMDMVIDKVDMKFDLTTLTPYASGFIILALLLVANFLAFCFYWIFRRWLKASMKKNTRLGRSNAISRTVGVSVGIVTALPVTIMMTNSASFISKDNGFTKFNSKLMKGITFGEHDGFYEEDKTSVRGILEIVNDTSLAENIAKIFSGKIDPTKVTEEQVEQIKNALNNTTLLKTVTPSFIQDQITSAGGSATVTSQDVADGLQKYMTDGGAGKDFKNEDATFENKQRTKTLIDAVIGTTGLSAANWYDVQMLLYGKAVDADGNEILTRPADTNPPASGTGGSGTGGTVAATASSEVAKFANATTSTKKAAALQTALTAANLTPSAADLGIAPTSAIATGFTATFAISAAYTGTTVADTLQVTVTVTNVADATDTAQKTITVTPAP